METFKGIQAIIFDLDGVIVDSEPLQQRAFNELLSRRGIGYRITDDEYGKFFVGVSVQENAGRLISRLGLKNSPDQIRTAHDAIYAELIADPKNLIAMSGLYALLDHLHSRGLTRGVATGSPRTHAEMVLRGLKIDSHFCAVVTGSDISCPKPDPEIYLRAIEALKVEPRSAIALEDSTAGIAAAKAAGLRAIAVPNRYTTHQDLSRADERLEGLERLIDLLE